MNKRLIALMCSAVITLSALSLTGCGEDKENKNENEYTRIVVDFNDVATLHAGNVIP